MVWASESKKWDVSLWARNLTNKEYFDGKLSLLAGEGNLAAHDNLPG